MPESSWHKLGLVIRRALRTPLAMALMAVGALFALLNPEGVGVWIFAAAMAVVLAYTVTRLRDEEFIRDVLGEEQARQRRSDLQDRTFRIEELEVESRVRMKTIVKLQSEIAEDVANSPVDEVAAGLSDTVEKTEELVERGLAISQHRGELQRYLTRSNRSGIESRIRSLEAKLEAEQEPERRSEINAALESKRKELEDHQAIEQASAHVLDQLDAIECAFSELRARLVRIKSSSIAEWVAANTELQLELGGLQSSVSNLEQSISEVLTLGGTE